MSPEDRIRSQLVFLYGEQTAQAAWTEMARRLAAFRELHPELSRDVCLPEERLTQRDAILITYGDQFQEPGVPPLRTLHEFLRARLGGAISGVHLLPCFPYTSDDGFSVVDYCQIDSGLGTWEDIAVIAGNYRLMLDAVVNHVSRRSSWFEGFLAGREPYSDYFITGDPGTDLSMVVRPRALPLLTPVETASGLQHVWTTFSDDQIDLNYASPRLLLEMTDVLLHYVAQGAELIRLDAIAYLWKEVGTACIHLPQAHAVVKLWRAVLDSVAPGVMLITETNVPHAENISYFGQPLPGGSTDEAQLVYNFSLAPLVLHALQTGSAERLSQWAAGLAAPARGATFFNFIASHDGIGVLPARHILNEGEIQGLVDQALAHGGRVSYKDNPNGSRSVYELNITLYDFLNDPARPDQEMDIQRFLAAQVILLSLAGVPGIYVHSLLGASNCQACVAATGRARSINREKHQLAALEAVLADPTSRSRQVLDRYRHLLRRRQGQAAFHPASRQQVLELHPQMFVLLRLTPEEGAGVLVLVNVSNQAQLVDVPMDSLPGELTRGKSWLDLIGGGGVAAQSGRLAVDLGPYQAMWLVPELR